MRFRSFAQTRSFALLARANCFHQRHRFDLQLKAVVTGILRLM